MVVYSYKSVPTVSSLWEDGRRVLGSYDVITDANGNVVERLSFDAWGNRRNPMDWREKEAPGTPHLFTRGFTGHEHLDRYGVINMNGRLYDPTIGRFFSPDPFVADATSTQDYNKYSYARNNPLMYTDPSGEFIWSYTFNFLKGLFTGGAPFKEGWNAVKNEAKIWGGWFVTDPNKSFVGQMWEFISKRTWELPQNLVGFEYSYWKNIIGNVDRVEYFGGATFVVNENYKGNTNGSTNGSFINMDQKGKIDSDFKEWVLTNSIYMHEYGHVLDSRNYGPIHLLTTGLPSIFSFLTRKQVDGEPKGVTTHKFKPWEMRANRLAAKYFKKYYEINWNVYEIYHPRERR